jgi:hypothetical protein
LLNLPTYLFRIKEKEEKKTIFDVYRHKWVSLTPEEWVRQNFIRYLTEEKHYPVSLVSVERSLRLNQQNFRADAVIFTKAGDPLVIIECKAPEVKISQGVFDQIVRYNMELRVKYLIVTNGLSHYCCIIDKGKLSYAFLPEIPDYKDLVTD